MDFPRVRRFGSILILVLMCGCAKNDTEISHGGDAEMNEEWKQCQTALQSVGGKVGKGSPKYEGWLKEKKLPDELARGLLNCSLKKTVGVSAIRLHSEADIISVNGSEGVPIALKGGFLILGTCPNGDPVVIDIAGTTGSVGYLCAETMWSSKDLRTAFVQVAPSLAAFIRGLSQDNLPADYFEATEARKK